MTAYLGTLVQKRKPKGSIKGVHPCPTCQIPFENSTGKKKFCSKECWPTIEKQCEVCTTSYQSRKKSERFCSAACAKNQKLFDYRTNMEIKNKDVGVECMICHQHLKSLAFHLKSAHQLTAKEYRLKYKAKTISTETSGKMSALTSGDKNAWHKHGGKLSIFSKNFYGYADLSKHECDEKIIEAQEKYIKGTPKESRPMSLQYWLNKGLTQEEAKAKLKERQSTFSLEKCIEKYGANAGLKRWQDRQEKWHKNYKKSNYSQVSQRLFRELQPHFICQYAEHGGEFICRTSGGVYKLDFFVNDKNKAIEFDGDYWHGARGDAVANKARSMKRDADIGNYGVQIHHVKECDFKKDPNKVIEECKKFLST